MPRVVYDGKLRAWDRIVEDLPCAQRNDGVLAAPDDLCGQFLEPAQQIRQCRVVHVGAPAKTARLFPCNLPVLGLFGRRLFWANRRELWRSLWIQKTFSDELFANHQEHVEYFAAWRLDARGVHEN